MGAVTSETNVLGKNTRVLLLMSVSIQVGQKDTWPNAIDYTLGSAIRY